MNNLSFWVETSLSKVCKKITDGTHDTPQKTSTGTPFITGIHVKDGFIDFKNCYFVEGETHNKIFSRCNPEKGDVLYVNIGAGICSPAYIHNEFEFSLKNVALLKPNIEILDGKYLEAYLLFSKRKIVQTYLNGGAQSFLGLKDIANIPIILPPLPEQRKIAAILSTWDAAIERTEQLIAALQKRKKGLMQRLLTGEVRFPGFEKSNAVKETNFGTVPVDWDIVPLKKVSEINGDTLSGTTDPDRCFFYIELSAVNKGAITFPEEKISFDNLPSRARRILHEHDVILSTVRPNLLGYSMCDFEPEDIVCSTGFALISPKYKFNANYIYGNLYGDTIQRQIFGLVTGSNYPAINSSEVKNLVIHWPELDEERKKIGLFLKSVNDEINSLMSLSEKYVIQKRGLMQRLLTGQIRVNAAN